MGRVKYAVEQEIESSCFPTSEPIVLIAPHQPKSDQSRGLAASYEAAVTAMYNRHFHFEPHGRNIPKQQAHQKPHEQDMT